MTQRQHKVLIIKVGYSETLDPEISTVTSYGDVLRSTVLLNLFKDMQVTWLVDEKAYPILKNNPCVSRVLIYNISSVLQLEAEHFDTVINLEKVPGLCALADKITAWRRYGFRFDADRGEAEAYDGTHAALEVCHDGDKKRTHNRYWQEHLFEMVGATWHGEEYVFGYEPKGTEVFDIGFNVHVGNKWPIKSWPEPYWGALERLLTDEGLTISWQQGLANMEDYFAWINSCRLLVTNDSFGLHVAIALKKKVVALFGPTNPNETYLYGRGTALVPDTACQLIPCYTPVCASQHGPCISLISPHTAAEAVMTLLKSETIINR